MNTTIFCSCLDDMLLLDVSAVTDDKAAVHSFWCVCATLTQVALVALVVVVALVAL